MINKLIEKYRNTAAPAKASAWFVISSILVKGTSFITLPVFSRILTTSEYGIVSVYQSWLATVSIITTLTLWGGVFNVGMIRFEERKYEMISSFQGLAVSITALFLILSIPVIKYLESVSGMSALLIVCMFIEIIFQVPHNLWATEQRYAYKYKAIVTISLGSAVVNPILGYLAVINAQNCKAEVRIMSALLVQIAAGAVLFVVNQYKGRRFFSWEFWKYGFRFNIVLIPHYISTQILSQSDRLMINNMCGRSDAGIYSVAYNFAMLLSLITSSINSSLTPYVYQSIKNGNNGLKKRTTAIVLFVAVITIGIICVVPELFTFLLPESYYPALKVIPPVTAAAFFFFVHPLFASIEFYYGKNKYVTVASVIGAVFNIILNYIFINIYGFMAAAYTTLFCYICFTVCHYLFMKNVLSENGRPNDIYDVHSILLISAGVLFVTLIMQILYNYILIRWAVFLTALVFGFVFRKRIMSTAKELLKKETA